MGYNLIIGEACFEGCKDDAYLRVWAKGEAHDEAPCFANDPITGNGNERSPGYSVWTNFCRETGLYGMFYGLNGRRDPYMEHDPECHRDVPILADHPGYAAINQDDVDAVAKALADHIEQHGELEAGFRPWDEADSDAPENASLCATRARLIWLDYWMRWAVANCEHPVICNS